MVDPTRYVAYSNRVILRDWTVKAESDPKIRFRLKGRDELVHFDSATRRRKSRAGQRYQVFLSDEHGEAIEGGPTETWLYGADWSHTQGATLALAATWLDWLEFWQPMSLGTTLIMTLVELGPDDAPVDQVKAGRVLAAYEADAIQDSKPVVTPEKDGRLKGGPISIAAARLCRDPDFMHWAARFVYDGNIQVSEKTTTELVRAYCGVLSRAELDHNDEAAERFKQLKSAFLRNQRPPAVDEGW